jgi:hypothetical protein
VLGSGSKINAAVIDVPLDEDDKQCHRGEGSPPFFADRLGVPGPGDGVVADLDLV